MTYIPEGTFGAAGAGGQLVAAWNRADITQFDGSAPNFSDGGGASSVLAAGTLTDRGPTLSITGAGTTMHASWLLTDPISFPDDRRDLIIELELAEMTGPAGRYVGVCLADEVGGYYALNHLIFGAAEWGSHVTNGVRSTAGGTGSGFGANGQAAFHYRGRRQSAAPPQVSSYPVPHGTPSAAHTRRTGPTAAVQTPGRPYGSGIALPAGWNGLQMTRVGICIQSSGGNPAPDVEILDFRVYLR